MKERLIDYSLTIKNNNLIPIDTYPNPQFKRDSYYPLNGMWEYYLTKSFNIDKLGQFKPIYVPAAFKSKLSQSKKDISIDDKIVYRKTFSLDKSFIKDLTYLVLLGFDQEADIYLNKQYLGHYIYLNKPVRVLLNDVKEGTNELIIITSDTFKKYLPYGKQSLNPKGMWYTSTEGIYFPLYLESLNKNYIEDFKISTSVNELKLEVRCPKKVHVTIKEDDKIIFQSTLKDNKLSYKFIKPHLWDFNDPFLYTLILETDDDIVESYFGLRQVLEKNKIFYLNGKRVFINGLLDQGYYLDGILSIPSYDVYFNDIKNFKDLGFNCLRKHIKLECPYYYYLCDKLGMMVIQDFVNNSKYSYFKETVMPTISLSYQKFALEKRRSFKDRYYFYKQGRNIVHSLKNNPSVIIFTIFNEGWGQFSSNRIYYSFAIRDFDHLYDSTSGWFRKGFSDLNSLHIYFRDIEKVIKRQKQPVFISEFGGYSFVEKECVYNKNNLYTYKGFETKDSYNEGLYSLYSKVLKNINKLTGVIYTQTVDVEDELNGLYTYDRKHLKINSKELIELFKTLSNYQFDK